MTRKQRLDELRESGYLAGLNSQPCGAPTHKELERAAWEIGWREGRADLEKTLRSMDKIYESFRGQK